MTRTKKLGSILVATALGAAALAALPTPVGATQEAKAVIRNAAGTVVAVAHLAQEGDVVTIKVATSGLAAGFHGFHVHDVGACDADAVNAAGTPTPYFTAGGHLKEPGQDHASHDGDLPVLLALAGKTQNQRVSTDRFTIDELLGGDGTAFIIHAGPDDYTHPAHGNAGPRIACGVIGAA